MAYRAPVDDIAFILESVVPLAPVAATERFAEATPDTVSAILTEAGRMASEVLAPLNRQGDLVPARLENGLRVMVPPFITTGEKIVVDTNEVTYIRRAD